MFNYSHKFSKTKLSLATIILISSVSLNAQENSISKNKQKVQSLNDVVVYGTKDNSSLQDTAASVAVFDELRIDNMGVNTLDDVLLRTPNVSSTTGKTSFSIRGIGQDGVGFAGSGATSTIYVDGAPLSFNAQEGVQSLWDVAQLEILRGPQSTVQGRNALAGGIVINTNDPTYDWEGKVRVQGGSLDTRRYSAVISGPIIEEQMAFRLAVDKQEKNADVKDATTGMDQYYDKSLTIRGKLLIEPESIPDLRVELTAEKIDSEFGEFNTVFSPMPYTDPNFSTFDPFGGVTHHDRLRVEKPKTKKYIADFDYQLNENLKLVSITTYEDHLRDRKFGYPLSSGTFFKDAPSYDETLSSELRLEYDFGNIKGRLGAYYYDSEADNNFAYVLEGGNLTGLYGIPVNPGNSIFEIDIENITATKNKALFGEITYEFNEQWALTLGARYDKEDYSDKGVNTKSITTNPSSCMATHPLYGPMPCSTFARNLVSNKPGSPAKFDAFLPRVSVDYDINEQQSLSFGIQKAYRAGGSTVRHALSAGINEIVSFEPEYTTNYELAYRSTWLDDKLTFNTNIFYTDWEDQQINIPGGSGQPDDIITVNIGESKLYGLEIDTNYNVSTALNIYGGLGLLHTEFTNFPYAKGEYANLSGNEFPHAPKLSASLGFSYEHSNGVYTSWNASHRSSQYSDVENLSVDKVSAYTLVNAKVGYRNEDFDVYLFANNLFDKKIITRKDLASVNSSTGQISANQNARFHINEPRLIGVSLEYRF